MRLFFRQSALVVAIAGLPAAAGALTLEDYLVANSSYEEASLRARFDADDGPRNDNTAYTFDLNSQYSRTFSTLPRSWNYTVGAEASALQRAITPTTPVLDDNGDQVIGDNGEPVTRDLPDSDNNWIVRASGTIDTYFHNTNYPKAFWFGQGRFVHDDSAPDDDISATVGLGYGRVYNATPLAKVIRIVEELNVEGLLTGPIQDSVALEVAEIIDRENEFVSRFGKDQYRRDYYAAIEAALARSGAIRDGRLGALGALTIDEILEEEPIRVRKHGWVVRLGAGFQASELNGLADNDPKLLLQWEYAKPFSYKGQFINLLTYEPIFRDQTTLSVRNEMSYTYELSDRVDWVNTWNASVVDDKDTAGGTKTVTHNLSSSYQYHLNNQLDYTATLMVDQVDFDPNPETDPQDADQPYPGDDPSIRFTMGFEYRLK